MSISKVIRVAAFAGAFAVVGAACSSGTPVTTVTPSPAPDATIEPAVTDAPAANTPQAPDATDEPVAVESEANFVLVRTVMKKYESEFGGGNVQIVAEVKNDGQAPGRYSTDTSYTIYESNGDIAEDGDFTPAPKYLAPGETGYLVAWENVEKTKDLKAMDNVEPSVTFETVEEIPADAVLPVSKVKVKSGDYDVWTEVTGAVENTGPDALDNVQVVVVYLDSKGAPMGFADAFVDSLQSGQSKGFKTDGGFMPGRFAKKVSDTVGVAYNPWDF